MVTPQQHIPTNEQFNGNVSCEGQEHVMTNQKYCRTAYVYKTKYNLQLTQLGLLMYLVQVKI